MRNHFLLSFVARQLVGCRKMIHRLLDIPIPILQLDGLKWTMSGIFLVSVIYTYTINKLSGEAAEQRIERQNMKPRTEYFARAKRIMAAQKADLERQKEQKRLFETRTSFRFLDLPPELALLVLAQCAHWPETYQSLVRTSRYCQRLTFHACLPRTPIRLITPEQVGSFDTFLHARPKLAPLIQHMWMTPLQEELLGTSIAIVKKCKHLRSLASNAYIVQEAISLSPSGRISHRDCRDLTLLSTRTESWISLLNTPNGSAFFRQLTHLRLIGDRIPQKLPLDSLTHLSYGSSGSDMSQGDPAIGLRMLEERGMYPVLHTVILTKPRASAGGLRISRAVAKKRVFIFELPMKRTELEIWCDNASNRGMWELCADNTSGGNGPKVRGKVRFTSDS